MHSLDNIWTKFLSYVKALETRELYSNVETAGDLWILDHSTLHDLHSSIHGLFFSLLPQLNIHLSACLFYSFSDMFRIFIELSISKW